VSEPHMMHVKKITAFPKDFSLP